MLEKIAGNKAIDKLFKQAKKNIVVTFNFLNLFK